MTFDLYPLRFSFIARESIHFPPGKAGNILRGAFGNVFRKIACPPACAGAEDCERRATCPYARLFEPRATGAGPSGLADWPRPFVIRASHLDGGIIPAGASFYFDLHLFEVRDPAIAYFVLAFGELARAGVGPRRGRAELAAVDQVEPARRVYDGAALAVSEPLRVPLELGSAVNRVRVRFLTPTELKAGQEIACRPEFGVLFGRVRDRLSTLRALYGAGPLEIDFKAMGERAGRVKITRCELRRVAVERRSARTGQQHPLGGFVGEVEYEGALGEFVPYLEAVRWTGVGRQTVWGNGEIQVETLA